MDRLLTGAAVPVRADPDGFAATLWPDVRFYDRQWGIVESVRDVPETVVIAAHKVGKDFVAGFLCLWYFVTHHPCRVVTTSVKDDHLRILWGEIGRFIDTSAVPLTHKAGPPLLVNGHAVKLMVSHREIKKVVDGELCRVSYMIGAVSEKGEGMAGHHAPHTMLVVDEASGADDEVYKRADTWTRRKLVFGNPYPCENFFRRAAREGSTPRRNVIRLPATASPNVREAFRQQAEGRVPDGKDKTPGVLSWEEYQDRLAKWDDFLRTVGLDAEFWEGGDVLMFPPDLLSRSAQSADQARRTGREEKAIGCDPGEGQANTAWSVVDCHGLVELVSERTPDTSVIPDRTITLMKRHNVPDSRVCFDRGGGGFQHAAEMRRRGYRGVRSVAFGESVTDDDQRHRHRGQDERREKREERTAYLNRRAQLYGELREAVLKGFGIPARYTELRRQLGLMPLMHDTEGRLRLPPKSRKGKGGERSLQEILGCSPDESDSLVVALFALNHRERRAVAGAAW